jgi:hypothetical protein
MLLQIGGITLRTITRLLKSFKKEKRGVSNVIVVMLSLVLIVIIVSNVVLWSYEMNQFDLERMQENVKVVNVTRSVSSPWFTVQNEYTTSVGSILSGNYTDTMFIDDSYEAFIEEAAQGTSSSFNPSDYILVNSTRHVSGDIYNLASNDGSYMNFRSYPNYEVKYNESLGTTSTTSITYQDKVSIVFTPQVTADFIIMATADVKGSSTNYQVKARLVVNSTTYQELLYRVKDTTDWYPFCGLKRIKLNENASYSIKIQFCTNNALETASIRNARLIVFSLQSEYAESEELSTTSSTSWQDKVTLTFTPPNDGDYLIIATANYRGSSTSRDVKIRLIQDDATVHAETIGRPGTGTTENYYTFGVMVKATLNAAPHNFKIQYCSSSTTGEAGIKYAHIAAIKLSQFDVNYYNASEAESITPASNTWYEKVANTYNAEAGNYLIIGSIAYKSGSTSYSVELDFQTESASRQTPLIEHRASTDYECAFFMTLQTLTAGNKTDRILWRGESTNARVKNARLISCKMPTLTQILEVEFAGNSNTQSWISLEWAMDLSYTTTNVATTLQLYNYQAGRYPTSGDGYMSETIGLIDIAKSQIITTDPSNYRDSDGKWMVKIRGVKATDTPFDLKVDWVEFKVTAVEIYQLYISNTFTIDLSAYPLTQLGSIEILIRYNVSEAAERWFLKAYNWTASSFSDVGFDNKAGNQPALNEWNEYAVKVTENCMDYVRDDGVLLIEFFDEGLETNQTTVGIDFFGVKVTIDEPSFEFRNYGPATAHIVSIWVINSISHQRYDVNLFVNSGEHVTYILKGVTLPEGSCTVKVITERGNVAVFSVE